VTWAEAYLRTKWHLYPSRRLATIHGPIIGGCCAPPFWGRGAGSPSVTMPARPRPTWYQVASLSMKSFGHNRHEPKIGGAVPPFGGAGSPSNTMWPGSRPTSVPSFVLIHPTVWSQYTNVTDRQTDRLTDWTDRTG